MATRPVFIPDEQGKAIVHPVDVEFVWHPGFSSTQKQKSVQSLHHAAKERGVFPLLEISGASSDALGRSLSAFHLLVTLPGVGQIPVECAFQGSKVFQQGGPYQELYEVPAREAKTDPRLRSSGSLVSFRLQDEEWPIEPKTTFYDWLYLSALVELGDEAERLLEFQGFTDIQFNPARSLNCQARSAALYVALRKSDRLTEAMGSQSDYLAIMGQKSTSPLYTSQPRLFSDP